MTTTRRTMLGGSVALAGGLAMPAIGRAAGPEFVYKFGVDLPAAHPTPVWAQKAADRIKAETDGRIEMQVFPNSQLGSSTDMTSQLRSGAIEFLSQSGPVLSQLVPAASINSVGLPSSRRTRCGRRSTASWAPISAGRSRRQGWS